MNSRFTIALLLLTLLRPANAQDYVHFLDGSLLRGRFLSYEADGSVSLQSPHSPAPLAFSSTALSQVVLDQHRRPTPDERYSARFKFFNGDQLYGDLVSMDERSVTLKSWFAGRLTGPRSALQSITFFNHGSHVIYSGPNGTAGWNVNAANAWLEQDGFLLGGPNAFLGREFRLTNQVSVEFKLMWQKALHVIVSLFTENHRSYNYNGRGYQLTLGVGYANLMRGGAGRSLSPMGSAATPVRTGREPVTFEIRLDREKGLIALLIDGKLVHKWIDPAGFASQQNGLSFHNRSQQISLGGIRVTEWDGGFEDTESQSLTNVVEPTLKLINHDTFAADIVGVTDDRVEFHADDLTLRVPLPRVKQIIFPEPILPPDTEPAPPDEPQVQARLMTDERLTLHRLNFARRGPTAATPGSPTASGRALLFGDIRIVPDWITELSFNPGQTPKPFAVSGIGPDGYWKLQ